MREFTRKSRKRQMLMSHCSHREIGPLPFLWVTGTSFHSGLLTWMFLTIRYSYKSSSHLKLCEGLKNMTSSLVCAVPYLKHTLAAEGLVLVYEQEQTEPIRGQVLGSQETRIPLLKVLGGCSGTAALYAQHRPFSVHQSLAKKSPGLGKTSKLVSGPP